MQFYCTTFFIMQKKNLRIRGGGVCVMGDSLPTRTGTGIPRNLLSGDGEWGREWYCHIRPVAIPIRMQPQGTKLSLTLYYNTHIFITFFILLTR